MRRIHDSLQRVLQRHRLVFWYDATGEWVQTFKAYPDDTVAKLAVAGNEFATKVRIVRDPQPEAKFLFYVPTARPADGRREHAGTERMPAARVYEPKRSEAVEPGVGQPSLTRACMSERRVLFCWLRCSRMALRVESPAPGFCWTYFQPRYPFQYP